MPSKESGFGLNSQATDLVEAYGSALKKKPIQFEGWESSVSDEQGLHFVTYLYSEPVNGASR